MLKTLLRLNKPDRRLDPTYRAPRRGPLPDGIRCSNVKRCELCCGEVVRCVNHFECLHCHACGDFNTGIMTRLDREYYQEMYSLRNRLILKLKNFINYVRLHTSPKTSRP